MELESGDDLEVNFTRQREVLEDDFEIADGVVVPAGDYRFDRYTIGTNTSSARPVNVWLFYGGGEFYTGTRDDYAAGFEWRPSANLSTGLEYEMNDVDLDEGDFED